MLRDALDRLRELEMWPYYALLVVTLLLAMEWHTERRRADEFREFAWACVSTTLMDVRHAEARIEILQTMFRDAVSPKALVDE